MTDMLTTREAVPLGEAAADLNDLGKQLLDELDTLCSVAAFHVRSHTDLSMAGDLLESARDLFADALDELLVIKRQEDRATRLRVVRAPDER